MRRPELRPAKNVCPAYFGPSLRDGHYNCRRGLRVLERLAYMGGRREWFGVFACLLAGCRSMPDSGSLRIAAASNLNDVASAIDQLWRQHHEHEKRGAAAELQWRFGASGLLATQILAGSPVDLFLSADREACRHIIDDNRSNGSTPFHFVNGALAWWPRPPQQGQRTTIAIADPDVAPYGRAAAQVLTRNSFADVGVVTAASVAGVLQLVDTGAADCGIVAASMAFMRDGQIRHAIENSLFDPIEQWGLVLPTPRQSIADRFAKFLTHEGCDVFKTFGYQPICDRV